MASSLPLLKFPYVVNRQLIQSLELKELMKLSLCSQKTKIFLKSYWANLPKVKIKVSCIFVGTIEITAKNEKFIFRVFKQKSTNNNRRVMKIGGAEVHFYPDYEYQLCTFWQDEFFGIKIIVDHVTDLFNTPVTDVKLCSCDNPTARERIYSMIPYPKNSLSLSYHGTEKKSFNRNNLLSIPHIKVLGLNLTSQQLNVFLKIWMSGGSLNLKSVHFEMQGLNKIGVFSGLDVFERKQTVCRVYEDDSGEPIEISGGFDIVRAADRKFATILLGTNDFKMIVWQ